MMRRSSSQGEPFIIRHLSLGILLLIAFALRVYRLDAQSIWFDESISLHLAASPWAEIVADRAANIHPPLYFFLLRGWVTLTGAGIFSARFLSAMTSLLQVALVYAIARRRIGRPAAWVGSSLTAISPLAVVYAQEIRVYAMLPLIYLVLLELANQRMDESASQRAFGWLLLGLLEVVGLHLHYTVIFLLAYVNVWSILTFWKEHQWTQLRRWLLTQAAVGMACVPWSIAVLVHWPAVQAEAYAGTQLTQALPLGQLFRQVWAFHLTGMVGALGRPGMALLAAVIALLLFLLSHFRLLRFPVPHTRRTVAMLAAHWLSPLSAALLLWTVRPFSHPRYLMLFTPGLTLLAAYAIQKSDWPKRRAKRSVIQYVDNIASIVLALALVLISLLGLGTYFFDPAFAKDDMRAVARYLQGVTGPDDLILVPDGDWTLPILYRGEASVDMPGMPDEEKTWANLHRWTSQSRRVFLMSYRQGISRDPRGLVPFALEKAGMLQSRRSFNDIQLRVYELAYPIEPPTPTAVPTRFGPLTLTEHWAERTAPADTALTVALGWRLEEPIAGRLRVNLEVRDPNGWPRASTDDWLLNAAALPTDRWRESEQVTTYHLLPLSAGTPPVTHTLSLGVYSMREDVVEAVDLLDAAGNPQGQSFDLETVSLSPPIRTGENPYDVEPQVPGWDEPVELDGGIVLAGASLDRTSIAPGESLFVNLRWQSTERIENVQAASLLLRQGGLLTAKSIIIGGRYPTPRWSVGQTVVEHRRLVVPATAADGPAEVILQVGEHHVTLGQVAIAANEHLFELPPMAHEIRATFNDVATLLGYDLAPGPYYAGQPITITLYWRALEGAANADYTVFTHLLDDDNRLVGQHDGRPVGGSRPSRGWIPGEILVDRHPMSFRRPYVGPVTIEVGLYRSTDMERVPTDGGGNVVLLPTSLTITKP